MTRSARNRFVAWLGIAAMWLAMVAPVISQTLAARVAAGDPQAALCAIDASSAQARASHEALASADAARVGHHETANHFEACAYCGLLAHNLPIMTGIARNIASVEPVTRVAAHAPVDTVRQKSFNAACPRAPPALS
jgi:hypothetical protein